MQDADGLSRSNQESVTEDGSEMQEVWEGTQDL